MIKNSGEIWPAKIRFGIEYGAEGDAQFSQEHVEIAGCATSAFVKDVYINNLPAALDSSGNADTKKNRIFNKYFTNSYIKSLLMIIYGKKRVINFSANVQAKEINNLYNNKI